jgi:hypothetical protein
MELLRKDKFLQPALALHIELLVNCAAVEIAGAGRIANFEQPKADTKQLFRESLSALERTAAPSLQRHSLADAIH